MRKSIVPLTPTAPSPSADGWLDLAHLARVEISSEEKQFPIENALSETSTEGWRALSTGPQVVRLHFDQPQSIRRIHVHFIERTVARSQEFALFANGRDGHLREVVRQQWGFSPGGSTEEVEDYTVSLGGVTVLELRIDPDRSHNPANSQSYASLASLKIA